MSESSKYTQNERECELHSDRVNLKTTLKTSESSKYTQNEREWKLHSERVKFRTYKYLPLIVN
jgi:hypothetical protein